MSGPGPELLDEGLDVLAGLWSGFDLVVWAEVAPVPAEVPGVARDYVAAGATWWIETARPEPAWWEGVQARVAAGPTGAEI